MASKQEGTMDATEEENKGELEVSQLKTKSVASGSTRKSKTSAISAAALQARVKVEVARARAEYAKKESQIMIEKAQLEAKLKNLQHDKEVAEAMAEANVLESVEDDKSSVEEPITHVITERTRQYVEQQSELRLSAEEDFKSVAGGDKQSAGGDKQDRTHVEPTVHVLRSPTPPRQRLNVSYDTQRFSTIKHEDTPASQRHSRPMMRLEQPSPEQHKSSRLRSLPHKPTRSGFQSSSPHKPTETGDTNNISDMARYLARRDIVTSGLTKFDDSPENYWAWRTSFRNVIDGLLLSANEELDLLVKWLGSESARHVRRMRAVHISDPDLGLNKAWQRLEECFGSAEVIEKSLFDKLDKFPKITNKDPMQLRELSDLLQELESAKFEGYLAGLGYLDTPRGIAPIVEKLPYNIQEKWISQGSRYKDEHLVAFPPFEFFCDFISREARARNDPSFRLSTTNAPHIKPEQLFKRQGKSMITVHKIDVAQEKESKDGSGSMTDDVKKLCPLHKKPHPLARCRGFRSKPLEERKAFLRDNGICFKCCSTTTHQAKNCTAAIKCKECESDSHISALHPGPAPSAPSEHGGEGEGEPAQSTITSKCTDVCGKGQSGRSCSKICLVNIFPEAHPESITRVYVVLDDQSNRSLARSELFDMFRINGSDFPFTLRTCAGTTPMTGRRAKGFVVESVDGTTRVTLPTLIECNNIPTDRAEIPTPEAASHHSHLKAIAHSIPPLDSKAQILLLLGRDILRVHKVREHRNGPNDAPYAQRLDLGWVIIGEVCLEAAHKPTDIQSYHTNVLENQRPSFFRPCANKIQVKEQYVLKSAHQVAAAQGTCNIQGDNLGSSIFNTSADDNKIGLSIEDRQFLEVMDKEMYMDDCNSWVAPLPFRTPRQQLPNNREQALMRLTSLQRMLEKRPNMKRDFIAFMQNIFDRAHAELAPALKDGQECWYLPTFGVYHPQKPDQIRVVFDSSAKWKGVSLNDVLLTGPDLNNSLIGVLMRFRREPIAATVDIEQMFHSFVVREDHRDFLRFLWYEDNDPSKNICEYRMKVHVFGNSPSPAVAIYGLRRAAAHGEGEYGSEAKEFIEREFYVDDGLLSRPSACEAVDLLRRTQEMLAVSNLRLHKVASNKQEVMEAFPVEERAKGLKDLNLDVDPTPIQRSLGVSWDLKKDVFTFQVAESMKPFTRRGVLATVNGLFDPLGFVSPVTIQGKILLRELTNETSDWDSPLPPEREDEWNAWRSSLQDLRQLEIPRPYSALTISIATRRELHVFSDASEKAIAAVAYLQVIDADQNCQLGFVIGKAKLAPQSAHTIPRLELGAAVLAVEVAELVTSELDVALDDVKFYTDSRVVLGYINNQTRRFYVYVSNRVQRIRRSSEPTQWHYISTSHNPADIATRSVPAAMLGNTTWLKGPEFLQQAVEQSAPEAFDLIQPDSDKEVRAHITNVSKDRTHLERHRFERFSSWKRLVRAISALIHIVKSYKATDKARDQTCSSWHYCKQPRTVEELKKAELVIIKCLQREAYKDELDCIAAGRDLSRSSPLRKLNPYCDVDGLLRVGGRLRQSELTYKEKHPLVIPGQSHIARLLVEHYHQRVMHQGRVFTEGALCTAGYWIMGARRLIKNILHNCITCNKLRGRVTEQRMADLPHDRLSSDPPFSYVGLDVFGPWHVITRQTRGGRANSKRWAVLFTCLSTRAVHIELIEAMDTSSFINALRRFFSLRGPAKQIRSDCGTNFVGAIRELGFLQSDPNMPSIRKYLGEERCSWILNAPHSSHMGGSWERMIGISRRILDSMLLQTSPSRLTHEVLSTLMAEVTAIINARPLTPISMDPDSPFLLTPAMLLTQKMCTPLPPSGTFTDADLYRQQWKQVQHLANTFWSRWRREYLTTLQSRNKWQKERPDLKVGDLVLLKDAQAKRNDWPMGLVSKTFPDKDGKTRRIEVKITKHGTAKTFLRPISETVLLMSPKD